MIMTVIIQTKPDFNVGQMCNYTKPAGHNIPLVE